MKEQTKTNLYLAVVLVVALALFVGAACLIGYALSAENIGHFIKEVKKAAQ